MKLTIRAILLIGVFQYVNISITAKALPSCFIDTAGLQVQDCDPRNTADSTDDQFYFTLEPQGGDLGSHYAVKLPSGVLIDSLEYGKSTLFGPYLINDGNFQIDLLDEGSEACGIFGLEIQVPQSCSTTDGSCEITGTILTHIDCDNQGTTDVSDDQFSFAITPTGLNLSDSFYITAPNGQFSTILMSRESPETLSGFSISSGSFQVEIIDQDSAQCGIFGVTITPPSSCSAVESSCNLFNSDLLVSSCQNQDTEDNADDTFSFSVHPTGQHLSDSFYITAPGGQLVTELIAYGNRTTFDGFLINEGSFSVEISDQGDPNCTLSSIQVTAPVACDTPTVCAIDVDFTVTPCNDNGSIYDNSDDYFMVAVENQDTVTYNSNLSTQITPGSNQIGPFNIADGDFTLQLIDPADSSCTTSIAIIAPDACSNAEATCEITTANLEITSCDDNGTPNDISDDQFSFSVDPEGTSLGTNFDLTSSENPAINLIGVSYEQTTIVGPISTQLNNFTINISDNNNSNCALEGIFIEVPSGCQVFNSAPIANDDSFTTQEDITEIGNVLPNDDGSNLQVSTTPVLLPLQGALSLQSDGEFTYIPNENYNGLDYFEYRVCNSNGLCDTARVEMVILAVNDRPIAANDTITLNENGVANLNVLNNDLEPDGQMLLLTSISSLPENGVLVFDSIGNIIYTPNQNFFGTDQATYIVCDSDTAQLCHTANLIITVAPLPDPPVAVNDHFSTEINSSISGNLMSNDYDPDGDSMRVITNPVVLPSNGAVILLADGTLSYTPNPDFRGTDQFTYQLCDYSFPMQCSEGIVTLSIGITDPEEEEEEGVLETIAQQAFSPNDDGINDTWLLEGIENHPNNEVLIYNRWGGMVWKNRGYNNSNIVFDGNFNFSFLGNNSKQLPDGTYYYVIQLNDADQTIESGFIELRR